MQRRKPTAGVTGTFVQLTHWHLMDPIHLHRIAVETMRARGLLPVFAPQALQEAEAARRTSPERNGTTRDLRHLTWFSIDNDDTRYLDQLSVAEPLAAGSTRLLVAVADVDAMVRPRRRGGYASGWWRWMQKKASSTSNTLELRSQKFA